MIILSIPSSLPALGFFSGKVKVKKIPNVVSKRLPLLSIRVRGGWQGWKIFQVRYNRQYVRGFSDYDKSAKAHLIPFQPAMKTAVSMWHSFSDNEKKYWNHKAVAARRHCSGYCLFISVFLKDAFR